MKKNLLILLFFAFVVQAKAALLIEPYAGAAISGTADFEDDDYDYSGTSMGGRIGFQTFGLFGGLDYRLSNFELDGDKTNESQYAVMVGYDFPILFRVWGEYIIGGEADVDTSDNMKLKDPSGTVLGFGFTGLPFVSINFEMANYSYDTAEMDSGDVDGPDMQHYLLSVSLPLTL